MNDLAGAGRGDWRRNNCGIFCEICTRIFAAIFLRIFAESGVKKSCAVGARGSSAGRAESARIVRLDGRLAQRLERPAYTGKVRGSNP